MKKLAIKGSKNPNHVLLIFHATPDKAHYFWQWYVTKDKAVEGQKIEGEEHESYTTSTSSIKAEGFDTQYLYCKFIDIDTKKEYKSEYLHLHTDFNKMIENGTLFDDISRFDEKGGIVKDEKVG